MNFKFDWDEDHSADQIVSIEKVELVKNELLSIKDGNFEIVRDSKVECLLFENEIKLSVYNQKSIENNILKNEKLITNGVLNTLNAHSDIEQGVYEGGFTIWDGSKDLIRYLIEYDISFENKSVLELGCGYGLPGIYSVIQNSKNVCFQDFNVDVLKFCTIPNTLLNISPECHSSVSFVSGDWRGLSQFVEESFDIILTAETIYRESHYKILLDVFKHCLKRTGRVYLNTKSNYYGVGGNVNDFINHIKEDNTFNYEIVQTSISGALRYVVIIWFK